MLVASVPFAARRLSPLPEQGLVLVQEQVLVRERQLHPSGSTA
jgi:hypothetical protein